MGQGLQDFYKTATRYGFARDNLLRLEQITGIIKDSNKTPVAANVFPADEKDKNFFVYMKSGVIPSRKVNAGRVSYKSFSFNVPMEAEYPENQGYAVEFYCDKYYIIRDILERWSNATFNEHQFISSTNFGECNVSMALLDNSDPTMQLENMRIIKRYTLHGAYPLLVGAVNYNTSSAGAIVSLPVTLAFQYVTSESGTF
jgi:hypothetical protein